MLELQDQTKDGSDHAGILTRRGIDSPVAGVVGGDFDDEVMSGKTIVLASSHPFVKSEEEIVHSAVAQPKAEAEVQLSKTPSLAADLAAVNQTLYPSAHELPPRPISAHHCNFTHYFSVDVGGKFFQDQYVYRHANGLCVVGLASTHPALLPTTQVLEVDFNVGKLSRAEMKVSGKHKKNGRALEANSALCKIVAGDGFYVPRCCVRGVLLEVNERLIKDPSLLKTKAATEGHIAVLMPRPEDWVKAEKTLRTREQFQLQRGLSVS